MESVETAKFIAFARYVASKRCDAGYLWSAKQKARDEHKQRRLAAEAEGKLYLQDVEDAF